MTNWQLLDIIEEIKKERDCFFNDVADTAIINRSYLSKFVNSKIEKLVTPQMLRKFKKAYPVFFESHKTNNPEKATKTTKMNSPLSDLLAVKLESKEELLAEKEKRIQEIEARRIEAIALANKMESHYNDMKNALERAQVTINEVLKPIKEKTEAIEANSITIRDQLRQVGRMVRADDLTMMDDLDRIAGHEAGTSSQEASMLEHALGAAGQGADTNVANRKEGNAGKAKQKRKT
jgi:hypothetical protein